MEEQLQTSGVEGAVEAAQQQEETGAQQQTGETRPEAGAKGDPETAWEKRISSMRQKWEQEVSQKYGDYDQLKTQAEQAKHLDRVARFNGFDSTEAYLAAIEQSEMEQQAQRLGLDPEVYRQQQELKNTVTEMQRQLQTYQLKETRFEQDKRLESDANLGELYKQLRDEVHTLADRAGSDYDVAFTLLLRDKIPSLMTGLKSQAEQETIRKITQNESTSTGALGAGEPSHKTTVSGLGKSEFNDLVQKVLRGEVKNI